MPTPVRSLATAFLLCLAGACGADRATVVSYESTPGGIQAGYLAVSTRSEGILATNQTDGPVHLIAIERGTTALADWIPCTAGPGCEALPPGQQRLIPWSSVLGAAADRHEYVVYWWHAVAQPDGTMRAGTVTSISVTR